MRIRCRSSQSKFSVIAKNFWHGGGVRANERFAMPRKKLHRSKKAKKKLDREGEGFFSEDFRRAIYKTGKTSLGA